MMNDEVAIQATAPTARKEEESQDLKKDNESAEIKLDSHVEKLDNDVTLDDEGTMEPSSASLTTYSNESEQEVTPLDDRPSDEETSLPAPVEVDSIPSEVLRKKDSKEVGTLNGQNDGDDDSAAAGLLTSDDSSSDNSSQITTNTSENVPGTSLTNEKDKETEHEPVPPRVAKILSVEKPTVHKTQEGDTSAEKCDDRQLLTGKKSSSQADAPSDESTSTMKSIDEVESETEPSKMAQKPTTGQSDELSSSTPGDGSNGDTTQARDNTLKATKQSKVTTAPSPREEKVDDTETLSSNRNVDDTKSVVSQYTAPGAYLEEAFAIAKPMSTIKDAKNQHQLRRQHQHLHQHQHDVQNVDDDGSEWIVYSDVGHDEASFEPYSVASCAPHSIADGSDMAVAASVGDDIEQNRTPPSVSKEKETGRSEQQNSAAAVAEVKRSGIFHCLLGLVGTMTVLVILVGIVMYFIFATDSALNIFRDDGTSPSSSPGMSIFTETLAPSLSPPDDILIAVTSAPSTVSVTSTPTIKQSPEPTAEPLTNVPTMVISSSPTNAPTNGPTDEPTKNPTKYPTDAPTNAPTTARPTSHPTVERIPTISPGPTTAPVETLHSVTAEFLSTNYSVSFPNDPLASNMLALDFIVGEVAGTGTSLVYGPELAQRFATATVIFSVFGTSNDHIDDWIWSVRNVDECLWFGISCHNGTVTEIGLGNLELAGTIPAEIGILTHLSVLDISQNNIYGPIPEELYKLTDINAIYLYQNELTGTLSPSIGNLGNLQRLHLSHNQFSGTIPLSMKSGHAIKPYGTYQKYEVLHETTERI